MGMDSDYSGRPIKWPPPDPNDPPFELDSLDGWIAADGTEVTLIGDVWHRITDNGAIGDPIPDIESLKPFK